METSLTSGVADRLIQSIRGGALRKLRKPEAGGCVLAGYGSSIKGRKEGLPMDVTSISPAAGDLSRNSVQQQFSIAVLKDAMAAAAAAAQLVVKTAAASPKPPQPSSE